MRRKGPFIRDVELHGHHRECDCSIEAMDRDEYHVCTCRELDHDDWIAAGEAEMDRRREEPRERVDYDD
jgi:hypothetical protein